MFRLSLSGIYNYFNPAVVKMYDKKLNRPLHQLINDDDNIIKVPKDIISEVFEKISKSKDMNEALYYIQIERLWYARIMSEEVIDMLYFLL